MSKIRIKIGQLEIDYDGDQEFIETGLVALAEQIYAVLKPNGDTDPNPPDDTQIQSQSKSKNPAISTNTIAQTIDAKTGSDLVLAAIAKIVIVNGAPTAGRQSILNEMKEATTYFKETYTSNLSAYLNTLVRTRRLNLVSKDTYSIPAAERGRLEDAIRLAS